jgi:hypothetical protein
MSLRFFMPVSYGISVAEGAIGDGEKVKQTILLLFF